MNADLELGVLLGYQMDSERMNADLELGVLLGYQKRFYTDKKGWPELHPLDSPTLLFSFS